MEKNVKMTNKMALEFVLGLDEVRQNVEVFDKVNALLTQINKKNTKTSGKLSKTQTENVEIKGQIAEIMSEIGEPCQIKDIVAVLGLSNQKVSALVRQMVKSGEVCRTEVKKVALFQLVSQSVETLEIEVEFVEVEENLSNTVALTVIQ